MLEPPNLPDDLIISKLEAEFGLTAAQVTFLPLGADVNTAVYRVVTPAGDPYFLKLRSGSFNPAAVEIPRLLRDQGVKGIIAPLETRAGALWANLNDDFVMMLSPFVAGQNRYEVQLTDRQRHDLGVTLKGLHAAQVGPDLGRRIPQESYSPRFRDEVLFFLNQVETRQYAEPVAARMAAFMRQQRDAITFLVERASTLAQSRQEMPRSCVLCHGDIHPGNWLITPGGELYIVDWDTAVFAPKEHDLMFAGRSQKETTLFYQGYGPAQVDREALAYYHYERIVQDVAAYGEQLLLNEAGGEDREQSYRYFCSNFLPGREIDIARAADPQYT